MRTSVAKRPFRDKAFVPYELITRYLRDIFSEAKEDDGYVCIRSGPTAYAAQSWISVDRLSEYLKPELSRHDYRDTYFSFSTYKKCRQPHRTIDSIRTIFAWSIDVDYKNESANPVDVYEYIAGELPIPKPNYIEYGHRLRMVYIFKEPLRLFPKQRDRLLAGFDCLQKSFCKIVNEGLGFDGSSFGAEANHASTFFRIPGSVNTKDGSTIKIAHISDERYTLQELFNEWVPDYITDASMHKSDWYDDWKTKKTSDSKSVSKVFNSTSLWERRMRTFEMLRTAPNPHRKTLCRFYGDGLIQMGLAKTPEEYEKGIAKFNEGFLRPLTETELRRHFQWNAKNRKVYRYSDEYLANALEVDRSVFSKQSRKEKDKTRYEEKRNAKLETGDMKNQKIADRRKKVEQLTREGMSSEQIAKKLGVSLSTVKRDKRSIALCKAKKCVENYTMKFRKKFLEKIFDKIPLHARGTSGSFAAHTLRTALRVYRSLQILSYAYCVNKKGKRAAPEETELDRLKKALPLSSREEYTHKSDGLQTEVP